MDSNTYCTLISRSLNYSALAMVGVYDTRRCVEEEELVESAMNRIDKKNGQYYLLYFDTDGQVKVCLIDLKEGSYEDSELESVALDKYLSSSMTVELSGNLVYKLIYDADKAKFEDHLKSTNENLVKALRKTQFKLDNSEYTMGFSSNDTCCLSDLYLQLNDDELEQLKTIQGSKAQKEKMRSQLTKRWLAEKKKLQLKFNDELEMQDDKQFYEFEDSDSVDVAIRVQFVFVLPSQIAVKSFGRLLENAFQRSLTELKCDYLQAHTTKEQFKVAKPQFYNFLPLDYSASVIHLSYPAHVPDSELAERRKQLCIALNLPLDKPIIKRSNALKSRPYYNSILSNVHVSLLAGLKGTVRTVQGTYSYFHYMQHNFNDNGWGCAYRSLQTLISWFDHQGYISIERIPTHREIQQVLVDIEDKKPSFVNSKGWIGSQEVGYVLKTWYGIEFKIMFVSSGAELASKGRELCSHFEKQGTPIMIGGGQLAHTILGVEFNEKTGGLRFLVLDPHYTGGEDLKTILSKVMK